MNKAWQCIGCGCIESQATCIGICHDVPIHIVSGRERTCRAIQARARQLLAIEEEKPSAGRSPSAAR